MYVGGSRLLPVSISIVCGRSPGRGVFAIGSRGSAIGNASFILLTELSIVRSRDWALLDGKCFFAK